MKIEEVVEYLMEARIVDLSKKVIPGKVEGPVDTESGNIELNPFLSPWRTDAQHGLVSQREWEVWNPFPFGLWRLKERIRKRRKFLLDFHNKFL